MMLDAVLTALGEPGIEKITVFLYTPAVALEISAPNRFLKKTDV